jgi:hypothetical protein
MALTNRERQARWRERLRARAAMPIAAAFREYARALMNEEWLAGDGDADAALARAARDGFLGKSDDEIGRALDSLIFEFYETEYRRLAQAKRRSKRSRRLACTAAVTNEAPRD